MCAELWMMDYGFWKKTVLGKTDFGKKNVIGKTIVEKIVFGETDVGEKPAPRSCFLKKYSLENQFFEMFGKCLEQSSNSRSKNRGQKSGGQIPAEKGLAKKPSQVLQQIDSNFKTTTRRRKRRRPKTGRRAKARRPVFGLLF